VPLALGALTLTAGYALRWRGPAAPEVRTSALAWVGATCLAFVTIAIPLQLQNEWVTIGWSLQGVATLMLWRRVDHAGLKYFALVLLARSPCAWSATPTCSTTTRAVRCASSTGCPTPTWFRRPAFSAPSSRCATSS